MVSSEVYPLPIGFSEVLRHFILFQDLLMNSVDYINHRGDPTSWHPVHQMHFFCRRPSFIQAWHGISQDLMDGYFNLSKVLRNRRFWVIFSFWFWVYIMILWMWMKIYVCYGLNLSKVLRNRRFWVVFSFWFWDIYYDFMDVNENLCVLWFILGLDIAIQSGK